MATPTVAKSVHQSFAETVRPLVPLHYVKAKPEFLVFPTGKAKYYWRIVASATNRTISRHRSLTFALRKCTRLNEQRSEGARNETN